VRGPTAVAQRQGGSQTVSDRTTDPREPWVARGKLRDALAEAVAAYASTETAANGAARAAMAGDPSASAVDAATGAGTGQPAGSAADCDRQCDHLQRLKAEFENYRKRVQRDNEALVLRAGEGVFSMLLAERATRVIAVDSSAKMIEVAREQALRHGVANLEYRLGDMEELPIDDASVDLVFFSQSLHHALHPERAIHEAWRILVPGGRIVLLDLAKHRFEEARELYADEWLGFSEAELEAMLEKAGFTGVQTSVVHKEPETPQFQTLLAVANKPA